MRASRPARPGGELLPPSELEAFEPFAEGERHRVHAGEEVDEYYAAIAEQAGMLAPVEEGAGADTPCDNNAVAEPCGKADKPRP